MENHILIDAPSPDETRKKLKKYARREARAMQALEQARRDLKKAEQKLGRATRNLQEHQACLHSCENALEEVRSARRAIQTSMGARSSAGPGPQEMSEKESSQRMVATAPGMTEISAAEAAVVRASNESAEEQKPPVDQSAFDANETIMIDQSEMAELLAGDDVPQPDEQTTRDLDAGAEQPPTTAPTRKATTRRPRTNSSSPARPTTTRRRTPSSRISSNKAEKAHDEENT